MDLGLEPSAIFLSTQKSTNKGFKIQNTGDLPVLRNLQPLPLLNRWPSDLNSFGAKRINWRRSNVMEVGDKNISKSPSILVFLKRISCIYIYYILYMIYIYLCCFGMLMFFFVVMFGELFFFQNFGDSSPGVFFGGQSFSDSRKKHLRICRMVSQGPKMSFFLILFKVIIPRDTVGVYVGCGPFPVTVATKGL